MLPHKPKKSHKKRKAGELPVEGTEMDVKIWKEYPEELMEVVVARLPVAAFLRFRSVSHKWNSLLGSPRFLQNMPLVFASYPSSGKDFIHCSVDEKMSGALYDPRIKKWHYNLNFPSASALFPACTAGGLVCYPDFMRSSFQVGNPLTQTWKRLPWPAAARATLKGTGYDVVGMVSFNQDYSARGYKIVWVSTRGQYGVYDSVKEVTFQGKVPAHIKLPFALPRNSALIIGTVVYFLSFTPDGILSYDVVSRAWKQFLIPHPPNGTSISLAECGGRILLVGLVKNSDPATRSVWVWELRKKMMAWKEVDKMPSSLCSELIPAQTGFKCFGNKRFLVIHLLMLGMTSLICMYDVVSREWSEVRPLTPPRMKYVRRKSCLRSIRCAITFFPSLLASP